MSHSKIGYMIQSGKNPARSARPFFGQTQILSLMGNAASRMNRQIPQMKLVNHRVHRVSQRWLIFCPALGIGLAQIENHRSISIHADSPGVRIGRFIPLLPDAHTICVELALQAPGHAQTPCSPTSRIIGKISPAASCHEP